MSEVEENRQNAKQITKEIVITMIEQKMLLSSIKDAKTDTDIICESYKQIFKTVSDC